MQGAATLRHAVVGTTAPGRPPYGPATPTRRIARMRHAHPTLLEVRMCEMKSLKIRTDENGYIVVETIGTFIPFVMLIVSILSLVNIVAVQARVHYAMTQAANTLSMYCYSLEVVGIANNMTALDNKANKAAVEVNAMKDDFALVLDAIGSLSDPGALLDSSGNVINRALTWGEEAVGDPKVMFQVLANYGLNELRSAVFESVARPLVGRYLSSGELTGNEYLTRAGVMNRRTGKTGIYAMEFYQLGNLGLGNSVMIDRNGNVKLVVEYEMMYTFASLRLPFKPSLRITQTVVTKAWLNGSGPGYVEVKQ